MPISALPAVGPTIMTDRLILRPPAIEDFDAFASIMMSERARHMGGPMDRYGAWLDFCMATASWSLRGYGGFSMIERKADRWVGMTFLDHDEGDPEPEIGWAVLEEAEGKGFAREAASAALRWILEDFGLDTLVAYLDKANARSEALAQHLGGTHDPAAPRPAGYPDCLVYRFRRDA